MKIKINRQEEFELLQALKDGVLDTEKIPVLHKVLSEKRPDLMAQNLSDEELDVRIKELEAKLKN